MAVYVQKGTSTARDILTGCLKITDGNPSLYKMNVRHSYMNKTHRIKKCILDLAEKGTSGEEKTIILVGSTGSGKSTLVDGMINFIRGVNRTDEFRLTVVDLMNEEMIKKEDQTQSQRDWITCYSIENCRFLGYKLNIIDTPGFGDVNEKRKNNNLVKQIKEFLSIGGSDGVVKLNAVCFVSQAPLARRSPNQLYVIDSILSIFGKDVAKNFINIITFADDNSPLVVKALKKSGVPCDLWFTFNNSALFSQSFYSIEFHKQFWEMGDKNYESFFKLLRTMAPVSLFLTIEVLKERENLDAILKESRLQANRGFILREEKIEVIQCIKKHEAEIERGKNFQRVSSSKFNYSTTTKDLKPGEIITVCDRCQVNCHYPCDIKKNEDKHGCVVFANGNCTVCPNKCPWNTHYTRNYKYFKFEVSRIYISSELEELYKRGQQGKREKTERLMNIEREMDRLTQNNSMNFFKIESCLRKLSEISLKSVSLNNVEHANLVEYLKSGSCKSIFIDND